VKIIDLKQNTPEWRSYRASKIGSSETGMICGVSRFKTAHALWREKMGLAESYISSAMLEGTRREPEARDAFSRMRGEAFSPLVVESSESPWLIASLDGYSNNSILEIKCPTKNYSIADEIPLDYIYQCNAQMYVTGADKCYLFYYWNELKNFVHTIKRDEAIIEEILEKTKKFYDSLFTFEEPDSGYLILDDNSDFVSDMIILRTLQGAIKNYEEQAKAIESKWIDYAKEKNANLKGSGVSISKCIRKGNVDYGKIDALKDIDLEQYRKPSSEYYKVLIKEKS